MADEPSSKRSKASSPVSSSSSVRLRPRFDSLQEEAVFVLLQQCRTRVCAPNEVVSQMIAMMKRFNWVGHFVLTCVLGSNLTALDFSMSHQGEYEKRQEKRKRLLLHCFVVCCLFLFFLCLFVVFVVYNSYLSPFFSR